MIPSTGYPTLCQVLRTPPQPARLIPEQIITPLGWGGGCPPASLREHRENHLQAEARLSSKDVLSPAAQLTESVSQGFSSSSAGISLPDAATELVVSAKPARSPQAHSQVVQPAASLVLAAELEGRREGQKVQE